MSHIIHRRLRKNLGPDKAKGKALLLLQQPLPPVPRFPYQPRRMQVVRYQK